MWSFSHFILSIHKLLRFPSFHFTITISWSFIFSGTHKVLNHVTTATYDPWVQWTKISLSPPVLSILVLRNSLKRRQGFTSCKYVIITLRINWSCGWLPSTHSIITLLISKNMISNWSLQEEALGCYGNTITLGSKWANNKFDQREETHFAEVFWELLLHAGEQ